MTYEAFGYVNLDADYLKVLVALHYSRSSSQLTV